MSDQPAGPDFDAAYPEKLRDGEYRLVRERRDMQRSPGPASQAPEPQPQRMVGVGLSGGGIRSATFCLGVFQGMAACAGLLKQIDFLSTVSGGGYFGSFYGRLLSRAKDTAAGGKDEPVLSKPEGVEDVLRGRQLPDVLRFLRENGRYLSPNGGGDMLHFGAAIVRNLVAIHLVLATFVLAFFLGLQWVRWGVERLLQAAGYPFEPRVAAAVLWSPLLLLPAVVFVVAVFPLGWVYWMIEDDREVIGHGAPPVGSKGSVSPLRERAAIPPWAGLLFAVLAAAWTAVATRDDAIWKLWALVAFTGIVTFLWWPAARWQASRMRRKQRDADDAEAATPAAAAGPATEGGEATSGDPPKSSAADRATKLAQAMDAELYRSQSERNVLGGWLTTSMVITVLLVVAGLVDSLGQTLWAVVHAHALSTWFAALGSSLAVLSALAHRVAVYFSKGAGAKRPALPVKLLASVAALLVVGALLVGFDAASHVIAWKLQAPTGSQELLAAWGKLDESRAGVREPGVLGIGFGVVLLLSVFFGQTWPFVNRSTQQPIYGARLTRAYLGASNRRRWMGNNVTRPLEGDDVDLARYWPPPSANGAPIHLINVTINETIGGDSQVQQQDRKGIGMALGPRGLSAGVRHHAVMPLGDDRWMNPTGGKVDVFPTTGHQIFRYPKGRFSGEMLPLGAWLSISGAAFTTGTGMRTSLGLSLLAGLGNVRLGRWWDSGVEKPSAADGAIHRKWSLRFEDAMAVLFPVQTYMLDEMLARFPGTSRRHWYLSDGGHFENLGGYELIRRRLPFIVIVDAEMDADTTFEGLANLMRKARLDFGAEVTFLDQNELNTQVGQRESRKWLGTLDQLRRGHRKQGALDADDPTGVSDAHAALARITYTAPAGETTPPPPSWLLYLKPTLTGDEPGDIAEYHRGHARFPHEPTSDQFFDEAQWESYRKLGEHVATQVFGQVGQLLGPDGRPWLLNAQ